MANAKNKIDSIFIGARDQSYHFESPKQSQQDITEIIDSAKKNGLIRATYENFTKQITIIHNTYAHHTNTYNLFTIICKSCNNI